jgi:Tol biopolymer transport system component
MCLRPAPPYEASIQRPSKFGAGAPFTRDRFSRYGGLRVVSKSTMNPSTTLALETRASELEKPLVKRRTVEASGGRTPRRHRWPWSSCLGLVAYVAMLACGSADRSRPSMGGATRLMRIVPDASVPVDSSGVTGPAVNADCRFVQLTVNNNVYVYDRSEGGFVLASQSSRGRPADSHSAGLLPGGGRLSDDGRVVAFTSLARDLVPDERGYENDIFARDLLSGQTVKVSPSRFDRGARLSSGGERLSGDGRVVAFQSMADDLVGQDTNGVIDVFVYDLGTREITRVSVPGSGLQSNGPAKTPALDAGGSFVAFASRADNLVPGDRNESWDVFLHDRKQGTTERVSVSSDGGEANGDSDISWLSSDARFVAFASDASNLVRGDTNGARDIFVRDRVTDRTSRVSVSSGRTQGNRGSDYPVLSGDARLVAFVSRATNLVPGDTNGVPDVFLHDRHTGRTERVSHSPDGRQANDESGTFGVALSRDGNCVVFDSYATNLVPDDDNGKMDVFVRDLHQRSE